MIPAKVIELDCERAEAFFANCEDLDAVLEKYPEASAAELQGDLRKLGCYLSYREEGMPDWLAYPQATRRAWGTRESDRAFNDHARQRQNAGHPAWQQWIRGIAKRAGIDTANRYYMGGLGRYDDPHAWVSTVDEVREVARKKNLTVSGAVSVKGTPVDPPKPIPIAPDIERNIMTEYIHRDPVLREKVRRNPQKALPALQEKVRAKHAKPS
jgi:hypothetical protein